MRAFVGGSGKDIHAAAEKIGEKRGTIGLMEDNLEVRDKPSLHRQPINPRRPKVRSARDPVRSRGQVARLWSERNTMTSFGCFELLRPESGRVKAWTAASTEVPPHDDSVDREERKCGVGTFITTVVPPFKSVAARLIMGGHWPRSNGIGIYQL